MEKQNSLWKGKSFPQELKPEQVAQKPVNVVAKNGRKGEGLAVVVKC